HHADDGHDRERARADRARARRRRARVRHQAVHPGRHQGQAPAPGARAAGGARMTSAVDISQIAGSDPVLEIAEEVFAAMIDGEPGLVNPWYGDVPALAHEIHAWVDVHGPNPGRVLVSTEEETAQLLARALLE